MRILPILVLKNTNRQSFSGNGEVTLQPLNLHSTTSAQSDIDINRLRALGIKNFRLIDSNSTRGVCLTSASDRVFNEMRESGIRTIIDLRREASLDCKYAKRALNNGLEYFAFPTNDSMPNFCKKANVSLTREEIKKYTHEYALLMKKFFEFMNEGHLYMSCMLGLHRTDFAVSLNYLLNPKEPSTPPTLSHLFYNNEINYTNLRIGKTKNLFNNLSKQDKEMLGLGEDYISTLLNRIAKLKMMNLK